MKFKYVDNRFKHKKLTLKDFTTKSWIRDILLRNTHASTSTPNLSIYIYTIPFPSQAQLCLPKFAFKQVCLSVVPVAPARRGLVPALAVCWLPAPCCCSALTHKVGLLAAGTPDLHAATSTTTTGATRKLGRTLNRLLRPHPRWLNLCATISNTRGGLVIIIQVSLNETVRLWDGLKTLRTVIL